MYLVPIHSKSNIKNQIQNNKEMKRPIVMFALVLSMGVFFTSCRDTSKENETDDMEMSDDMDDVSDDMDDVSDDMDDVNDDMNSVGNDIEQAADDAGDAVKNAAKDVKDEVEGNDDY